MKTKASNSTALSERTECEMDRELITKTEDFLKQKFDSGLYLSEHPDDKAGLLHQLLREAGEPAEIKL